MLTLSRDKRVFKVLGHPQIIYFVLLFQGLSKIPPGERFGEDFGGLGTIFSDFWGALGDPILILFRQKWGPETNTEKVGFW